MNDVVSYSVVVLEESPCPQGSSRTNFQVLVFGHQVLVLVLESQILDSNTGFISCVVSFQTEDRRSLL